MKFLPSNHRAGKITYKNSTSYFVWDHVNHNIDNGILRGPGIEVTVVNPTVKYIYNYEYPTYQKFLNAPKFIHMHGICPGSLVTSQLPLFHVNQTYPYWKRMYANEEFDHYIMMLVGVSVFDYRLKFNMPIGLDESQSNTVQRLAQLFDLIGIAPPPINVKLNNVDEDHDYNSWGVVFDYDKIEYISDSYCYLGDCLSRYEINNAISGLKKLPRFWEQRNHRSLELSDIVCENQMVLF